MRLRHLSLLLLAIAGAGVRAADIATPAGTFALPERFFAVSPEGQETASGRLYVFAREGDVFPQAAFMLTVIPLTAGPLAGTDALAVQLADPARGPDGRLARRVKVGGVGGHRHSKTQWNRMVSTAYVVDREGHRLLVQMTYPGSEEYRADAALFEQAVRAFRWSDTDAPAAPADPESGAPLPADDARADAAVDAAEVAPVPDAPPSAAPVSPMAAPAADAPPPATAGVDATASDEDAPAAADASGASDAAAPIGSVWSEVRRVAPGLELGAEGGNAADAAPPAAAAEASATGVAAPPAANAPEPAPGSVWSDVDRISVEDLLPAFRAPSAAEAEDEDRAVEAEAKAEDGSAEAEAEVAPPAGLGPVWSDVGRIGPEEAATILASPVIPDSPDAATAADAADAPGEPDAPDVPDVPDAPDTSDGPDVPDAPAQAQGTDGDPAITTPDTSPATPAPAEAPAATAPDTPSVDPVQDAAPASTEPAATDAAPAPPTTPAETPDPDPAAPTGSD